MTIRRKTASSTVVAATAASKASSFNKEGCRQVRATGGMLRTAKVMKRTAVSRAIPHASGVPDDPDKETQIAQEAAIVTHQLPGI